MVNLEIEGYVCLPSGLRCVKKYFASKVYCSQNYNVLNKSLGSTQKIFVYITQILLNNGFNKPATLE